MTPNQADTVLSPPRFVAGPALRIVGLTQHFAADATAGIPALWQRVRPYIGTLPGEVPGLAYGVCGIADAAGGFDYTAGVAMTRDGATAGLVTVKLAPQRYAVFIHRDHVATVPRTMDAIWNTWLPASGETPVDAPTLERYDRGFDPRTGTGGFEIWLPLHP